jgi:alkanesulfonate monooxygenase SsuD/methylene tetrahydromethanopterin reductase-like flavin-dependent oxidoreductase (luciferase family)
MRAGIVILPEHRWPDAAERWRRAEEYGFHHAWTYDHLAWRGLADGPWFATVPTLAAAAGVTSTIRLGTFVASPNFRHPVPFAKDLMTLDDLSGGRFTLGVGAGGAGRDSTVLGGEAPPAGPRTERFGEFVELLDALLTRPATTWRGQYYEAVDARMVPGCVQQPRLPFAVAANGPRALAVAARFGDGWVTTGITPPDAGVDAWWRGVGEVSARMDEALAAAGRKPTDIRRYLSVDASGPISSGIYSLASAERFAEMVGRAEQTGFTDVVAHWPRPDGVYAGDERVLDAVAPLLRELDGA